MISISNLRFAYPSGEFSLAVPDMKVAVQERVAIIGPSGSGKTTLLSLVAGLLQPRQGTVEVDGTDLQVLSARALRRYRATRLGFIFQDFGLLDYLSVEDNIIHPYRVCGALAFDDTILARAHELAVMTGIDGLLERRPSDLSHGERQRTGICRALLTRPTLVLADEATGNLDPKSKDAILDLLFEIADAHQTTILAVTHDMELVPRFDRVIDFAEFAVEAES